MELPLPLELNPLPMASLCCHGNCHLPAGELELGVTQWGGGTGPAGPVVGTVVAGGQHVP